MSGLGSAIGGLIKTGSSAASVGATAAKQSWSTKLMDWGKSVKFTDAGKFAFGVGGNLFDNSNPAKAIS